VCAFDRPKKPRRWLQGFAKRNSDARVGLMEIPVQCAPPPPLGVGQCGAVTYGAAPGSHRIAVRAHVAGAGSDPPAALTVIELSCPARDGGSEGGEPHEGGVIGLTDGATTGDTDGGVQGTAADGSTTDAEHPVDSGMSVTLDASKESDARTARTSDGPQAPPDGARSQGEDEVLSVGNGCSYSSARTPNSASAGSLISFLGVAAAVQRRRSRRRSARTALALR